MKMRDIPETVIVGKALYDIRFAKIIEKKTDLFGLCDSETKEIWIKKGLSRQERAMTLIHELLHAIENEYDLHIDHSLVYKLEKPIYDLIVDNWVYFSK